MTLNSNRKIDCDHRGSSPTTDVAIGVEIKRTYGNEHQNLLEIRKDNGFQALVREKIPECNLSRRKREALAKRLASKTQI